VTNRRHPLLSPSPSIYIQPSKHSSPSLSLYIHTYAHTYMHTNMHTCKHINTHTHTHIHMYIYKYIQKSSHLQYDLFLTVNLVGIWTLPSFPPSALPFFRPSVRPSVLLSFLQRSTYRCRKEGRGGNTPFGYGGGFGSGRTSFFFLSSFMCVIYFL
jgi:hypothetical protein